LIISAFQPNKAIMLTYEDMEEKILSSYITQSMNLFYYTYKKSTDTN